MDIISLSVRLHYSCCSYNYLLNSILGASVWMYGRKYYWGRTGKDTKFSLFCNGHIIGCLDVDTIHIFSSTLMYCPNESFLKALMALFNLYPL